jgi:hypothetical protein
LPNLFFDFDDGVNVPPKRRLAFKRLHVHLHNDCCENLKPYTVILTRSVSQNGGIKLSRFEFHDVLVFDIIREMDAITGVLNEMNDENRQNEEEQEEK